MKVCSTCDWKDPRWNQKCVENLEDLECGLSKTQPFQPVSNCRALPGFSNPPLCKMGANNK